MSKVTQGQLQMAVEAGVAVYPGSPTGVWLRLRGWNQPIDGGTWIRPGGSKDDRVVLGMAVREQLAADMDPVQSALIHRLTVAATPTPAPLLPDDPDERLARLQAENQTLPSVLRSFQEPDAAQTRDSEGGGVPGPRVRATQA